MYYWHIGYMYLQQPMIMPPALRLTRSNCKWIMPCINLQCVGAARARHLILVVCTVKLHCSFLTVSHDAAVCRVHVNHSACYYSVTNKPAYSKLLKYLSTQSFEPNWYPTDYSSFMINLNDHWVNPLQSCSLDLPIIQLKQFKRWHN